MPENLPALPTPPETEQTGVIELHARAGAVVITGDATPPVIMAGYGALMVDAGNGKELRLRTPTPGAAYTVGRISAAEAAQVALPATAEESAAPVLYAAAVDRATGGRRNSPGATLLAAADAADAARAAAEQPWAWYGQATAALDRSLAASRRDLLELVSGAADLPAFRAANARQSLHALPAGGAPAPAETATAQLRVPANETPNWVHEAVPTLAQIDSMLKGIEMQGWSLEDRIQMAGTALDKLVAMCKAAGIRSGQFEAIDEAVANLGGRIESDRAMIELKQQGGSRAQRIAAINKVIPLGAEGGEAIVHQMVWGTQEGQQDLARILAGLRRPETGGRKAS